MNAEMWTYWFPIAFATVVAAALLGKSSSTWVGLAGGVAWIALLLGFDPGAATGNAASTLSMLLGVLALVGAGFVVARRATFLPSPQAVPETASVLAPPAAQQSKPDPKEDNCRSLDEIVSEFEDWLVVHRSQPDPWPDFGEFLRGALFASCRAERIRPYRLMTTDDDRLHPLQIPGPDDHGFPSARAGILGHVVTTGKPYYAGDPSHGILVERLAREEDHPCAWCFAVRRDGRTVGLVSVGQLAPEILADRPRLRLVEGIVGLCWAVITESCRSRLAGYVDPVTGVLTQEAFSHAAERSLSESYKNHEPVAMVNVSIEGLRRLADVGKWETVNQLLFEVSSLLRERIRGDDEIGVLDGSRFLLLLRRVDSELAMLIVQQLMEKLVVVCGDQPRWGVELAVRCGVAGSGVSQPTLRTLVARSTANCHKARNQNLQVVSDLSSKVKVRQG